MKKCAKCKQEKATAAFNMRGGKPTSYCKECQRAYTKAHYKNDRGGYREKNLRNGRKSRERAKAAMWSAKERPCSDCGKQYPPYVMQFDHLGEKLADVARLACTGVSIERLMQEIEKCEVVCANCHAERTYQRRQKTE